jgi:hypothetical protein
MNLWNECIREALCEAGIAANDEQIEIIVGYCEGLHENYGMYSGNDVADSNFISDDKRELDRIKKEQEDHNRWELNTKPCKHCTTTGVMLDGWGRNQTCDYCNGKGRI